MDLLLLVLRLLHIVAGALWVGMAIVTTAYVAPAIQEAGPDGGKVMMALQRRGYMNVIPLLAAVTIASGLWLYWRASLGFRAEYLGSNVGAAFGGGAVLALVGFAIGMGIMRPAMLRSAVLAQSLPAAAEAEKAGRLSEIQRLRARGAGAGRVVAVLLFLATALMAVARYL